MGLGSKFIKRLELRSIFKLDLKNFTLLKCVCHTLTPLSQISLVVFSLMRKATGLEEKWWMKKLERASGLLNLSRPQDLMGSMLVSSSISGKMSKPWFAVKLKKFSPLVLSQSI